MQHIDHQPETWTISDEGINLIAECEGFSAMPYLCPGGVWSIGYGHTQGVDAGTLPITEAQGLILLKDDIAFFENALRQLVEAPLTQQQFSALVSFVFNIGEGAFSRSTLLKKLNSHDNAGAAEEFPRWVYAKGKALQGLRLRRKKEKEMFLQSSSCDAQSAGTGSNGKGDSARLLSRPQNEVVA